MFRTRSTSRPALENVLNPLYELAEIFTAVQKANAQSDLDAALGSALPQHLKDQKVDAITIKLAILSLHDDCISAASHSKLGEERVGEIVKDLTGLKGRFMLHSSIPKCGEFRAKVRSDSAVPLLNAYGDTFETSHAVNTSNLNRPALVEDTLSLIEAIKKESDLPVFARDALLLKLQAVSRIIIECKNYSDQDIRRRVKAVYADFCGEFDRLGKAHEKTYQKMAAWARKAVGSGFFMLALTADASAVAGLLERPKD